MLTLKDRLEVIEREEIIAALRECGWIMAKAARRLGITERMIGYKVRKYGIKPEKMRHDEDAGLHTKNEWSEPV